MFFGDSRTLKYIFTLSRNFERKILFLIKKEMITLDDKNILSFLKKADFQKYKTKLKNAYSSLINRSGKGNEFLGWLDLPDNMLTSGELTQIQKVADRLKTLSEIVVVIGIGGSYLGSRAVIEALGSNFKSLNYSKGNPLVVYAGHQIGEDYMVDLLELLNHKEYSLIIISKSGTTTEPALAFRILKNHCEQKYGKSGAQQRIVAITDKSKGALKTVATTEGYDTFVIPDDVGGRFSVLTAVGLLPIAVSGFDINQLCQGASQMRKTCFEENEENPAMKYALARNLLYAEGYKIELMVNYLPSLAYFTEWWKQLYGESEGKENKGLFPAGVSFSTDLHSMGQYIQQGERHLFETMIWVENTQKSMQVPMDKDNLDGLNFLAGKSINEVNEKAFIGTTMAHLDGQVPVMHLRIPELNERNLGGLIYFYEFACALSGYIIDVNPFDQPGVEDYKKNMFAMLDKPGFETLRSELLQRM